MSNPVISFPGESEEYRTRRNELLEAELELRAKIEAVAAMRRTLPLGGAAQNYVFAAADGPVTLAELFGDHRSLIVYSYMYGPDDDQPCPMCSAYIDSLSGQLKHISARTALVVAARSPIDRITKLTMARGWQDVPWVSAAGNTYAQDYKSEMPNGAQVPMCNVFVKDDSDEIRHFWCSEMFFAPSEFHPRHVDMLWPLWHHFDLTPQGRGDFMPRLEY